MHSPPATESLDDTEASPSLAIPEGFKPPNVWILSNTGEGSPYASILATEIENIDAAHDQQRTAKDASFSRYLVKKVALSRGGMGAVFEAFDLQTRMVVIIKFAHPDHPIFAAKLAQEAKIMAKIESENPFVVPVLDFLPDTRMGPALILRRMDPKLQPTLAKLVEANSLQSPQTTIQIITDVAGVIDYMWEKHQILHYDLKPTNIFYNLQTGRTKVADFGLAAQVNDIDPDVLGTVSYTSPERIDFSNQVDIRSEIFSLALITYFLITGISLFSGSSATTVESDVLRKDTHTQIQNEITNALQLSGIGNTAIHQVIDVMNKALEKDRTKRYASASEFANALQDAIQTAETIKKSTSNLQRFFSSLQHGPHRRL